MLLCAELEQQGQVHFQCFKKTNLTPFFTKKKSTRRLERRRDEKGGRSQLSRWDGWLGLGRT